ncbi:hypothetical protein FOL47_009842 [Perkinsus chesapeaki]|uniref:RING-type domain-containing protein n=1 Tax=Perkinsus chesapeaki TaxID=330153 RepID=A0A7J6L697_PERCH|nr:hypothetical protein FOL47_009842 [Perkinsus chesapeaki]
MLSRFRHPAFSRKYLPIWISWIILVLLFTAGIFFFPSSGTNLRLLVSFVYVFALLLLPPIIICWYARRKANQQRRQLGTASPEEFHDEWRNWVKSKTFMTTVDEGSCAICLSDYSPGQDVRVLACKHKFHPQCFDSCFEENLPRLGRCHKCPLCRCDLGPVLVSSESDAISVM